MSSLFNIGVSGLLTARRQLTTTGHNITNLNTPGYVRQSVEQKSAGAPTDSGAGYSGNGVQSETAVRHYDQFLEQQVRSSQSQLRRSETFYSLSSQVDSLFASQESGLSPALDNFFSAVQQANNQPSDQAARSVLLSESEVLSGRFQSLQNQLNQFNNQANQRLTDISSEISNRAASIADLNQQISQQANPASDLLDRREHLINEISERIEVDRVEQADGSVSLMVGAGQALVAGGRAAKVSVSSDAYPTADRNIMLTTASGRVDITSQIRGGELQGVLDFKSEVLEPALNGLGSIATALADEFNQQHQAGVSLQQSAPGVFNPGGDFFTDLAGSNQTAFAADRNQGNGNIEYQISDTSLMTSSDYEMSFRSIGGTHTFSMTRLSDGTVFSGSGTTTAGALAALNNDLANTPPNVVNTSQGLDVQLNGGVLADGDQFLLQPSNQAAGRFGVEINNPSEIALASSQPPHGDNRNGLLLSELQTKKTMLGGTADFQSVYGLMTAGVGTLTQSSAVDVSAQTTMNEQALQARESLSGVNLDEEAAQLLKFQQLYPAAAKVIVAADEVFQTLLDSSE